MPKKLQEMEFTGERYVPEIHGSIELEHVHRYLQAREIAAGKVVLDIASGEGYGTAILAQRAKKVIGVDISADAIEHARGRYQRENVEYLVGDCAAIPLTAASVDLVVSFETLEHHNQHEEMMREVKRVLRPGGVLLISSPDKYHYSDEPGYHNEYHIKELYKEEFLSLLSRYFKNCDCFGQRVIYGSAIFSESESTPVLTYFREKESVTEVHGLRKPTYWIGLASDGALPVLPSGALEQSIEESDFTVFWRGVMAERDAQILELQREVTALSSRIENLVQTSEEKATQVDRLQAVIGDQNTQLLGLRTGLAEKARRLVELEQTVGEREGRLEALDRMLHEQKFQSQELQRVLAKTQETLKEMLQSKSWKLTAPLRQVRRIALSRPVARLRKDVSDRSRALWHSLPFSTEKKQRLKSIAFSKLPVAFQWSRAYRDWVDFNAPAEPHPDLGPENRTKGVIAENPAAMYVPLRAQQAPFEPSVRLIAFYLPQFHAIPENDEWWGKGFTEWTNVTRAAPIFEGHYQPRVPGELGYYDLLDGATQRRQVELARLFGLSGFCFYFYWFGGKRLLERPVENYLNEPALDFPFCLCWANENWSRRWDGLDNELLISQNHSPADDFGFIECVGKYLRDPRYIRIDNKPLLLVYRPNLLPTPRATADRWRSWCRQNGLGEIYLAYTQSFDSTNPKEIGFDAAVEFPPNNSSPPNITDSARPVAGKMLCKIFDWDIFVERSRNYKEPAYKLFRSVCPSWDNTARRKKGGTVFLNSTPERYKLWLKNAIANTIRRFDGPDERLVFVNAWNEWAEGAYLEPDQRYGYAYLQATRDALVEQASPESERRVVVVAHDAHPHGAQFLALGIVRTLSKDFGFQVWTVLLGPGMLTDEFRKLSTNFEVVDQNSSDENLREVASRIYAKGFRHGIVNSTASGRFGAFLGSAGVRNATLIHELPGVIRSHKLQSRAQAIARSSGCVIFPAESVREAFVEFARISPDRQRVHPQGLWRRNQWRFRRARARSIVRNRIGASESALLVLTVGYADLRKGVDLFVEVALKVLDHLPDAHFVWIGHWDVAIQESIEQMVAKSGRGAAFHFIGFESATGIFHAAADVFALTSREDPFPNVVLESFDAGVPVIAFEGSGGGAELVVRTGGEVVPPEDAAAFADAILNVARHPDLAIALGQNAMREVDRHYAFRAYLFDVCEYLGMILPRVTVIVPNYNYARHIVARLQSIVSQTIPIFEIIILDDASTDDSVDVIASWLEQNNVEANLIVNDRNSGSVVRQWAKGVALARGEYVWIAEADDLCSSDMLQILLRPFYDREVVLSYCESKQIDEAGAILAPDYHEYLKDVSASQWRRAYVRDGKEEIAQALAIKNTIPNVSGVVFRRETLASILSEKLETIAGYRQAADWYVYIEVLEHGKVAFSPRNCNAHRRHSTSVVGAAAKTKLLMEITCIQQLVAERHDLSDMTSLVAERYLGTLKSQFGLAERAEITK